MRSGRIPHRVAFIAGLVVVAFLLVKARFEESQLRVRYRDYEQYRSRTRGVLFF